MNNKIGVAAIIFASAALIAAIGTAVVNFLTLKWAVKLYEPFDRMIRKTESLVDKCIAYTDGLMDNCISERNDD